MERNAITIVIFLFLIVADVSNASSFWKRRYLADESPTNNNNTAATPPPSSPLPSPVSGLTANKTDPKPDTASKLDPNPSNKTDSGTAKPLPDDKKDPTPSNKTDSVPPPQDEKKDEPKLPPQKKETDGGDNSSSTSKPNDDKTMEDKKKNVDSGDNPTSTETEKGVETKEDNNKKKEEKTNGDETDSKPVITETCDGVVNSCTDGKSLTACIKGFESGSKELVVLVQNSGEKSMEVNVVSPGEPKGVKVPKHGTEMINITVTDSKSSKLVLSAGNGDCELVVNPLVESQGNFFLNLPSYEKLVTPINGAYFLIVTVVIFGGSWACCMFRKRRRHDGGIPYQELEMGLPESMAATDVETAEGWDQGWDDDWDEDKAVKSPVVRHANISANGLTARSSNRDGWDNDWDD